MTDRPAPSVGSRFISTAHGTHRGAFSPIHWALLLSIGGIWGASFLFMAIGLESFRPGLVTWLRVLLGAGAIWCFPRARQAIQREDWPKVVVLSITWVAIPFTLFPLAQGSVNSAIAGMLNGAAPIFVTVIASILLRRAPGRSQLIGIPIGFAGVTGIALSVADQGPSQVAGVVMIVVATMCYGVAFNVAAPLQQRYGAVPVMARTLALGAILTAPLGLVGLAGSGFSWPSLFAMVAVGVLGTGIAFVLMGILVGRVGSTRGSVVAYVIPVVALALGVVFRDDHVGTSALVGVALVVVGAFLSSRREVPSEAIAVEA